MILPLSVVLLATFDYIHATQCSAELSDYMNMRCRGLASAKLTYAGFSACSFTCKGTNAQGKLQSTTLNLEDGLPCGPCQQCCSGICRPVSFKSYSPFSWKSCTD
uniref:Putative ixostatin n=1 Tax=Ixodes ricinus TaxID=34613 RepID=A0A0K8RJ23_IXORI